MRSIMNFIFNNIFLILFVAFVYYIYTQYKDLKEKETNIKHIFEKTLNKYIDEEINKIKEKVIPLKTKYSERIQKPDEEKTMAERLEEGKKDIIVSEINRLLMVLEKTDTINGKVDACNAINKFRLSNNINFEEFPDMEELNEFEIFTEEVMNSLENGIAIARREYNAGAFRYNEKTTTFPIQYMLGLLRLVPRYNIFDAPKYSTYAENFEVFEEVEPEIHTLESLNLTSEEIEREAAEKEELNQEEENKEVVIEHSDVVLKPSIKLEDTPEENSEETSVEKEEQKPEE